MGGEAYNKSAFGEVVHGRGKRVFDSQSEIPQGAVMETVDGHRHDIDHEMAEEVEALKRLLSACEFKRLRNTVRGRDKGGKCRTIPRPIRKWNHATRAGRG